MPSPELFPDLAAAVPCGLGLQPKQAANAFAGAITAQLFKIAA
jgi:hypothetical protein